MAVYPLFTQEAQDEAKKYIHPRYSKSMWKSPELYSNCPYEIKLDAVSTIYTATKE